MSSDGGGSGIYDLRSMIDDLGMGGSGRRGDATAASLPAGAEVLAGRAAGLLALNGAFRAGAIR